jgi:hypothetical protein
VPGAAAVYSTYVNTPLVIEAADGLFSATRPPLFTSPAATLSLATPNPRVTLDASTGAFVYWPTFGFAGRDEFRVSASGASCGGATGTAGPVSVYIDVAGKPPLPTPSLEAANMSAVHCKLARARVDVNALQIATASLQIVRDAAGRATRLGAPDGVVVQITAGRAGWPAVRSDGSSESSCHMRVPGAALAPDGPKSLSIRRCRDCVACFRELNKNCSVAFRARVMARAGARAPYTASGWSEEVKINLACDRIGGKRCHWT